MDADLGAAAAGDAADAGADAKPPSDTMFANQPVNPIEPPQTDGPPHYISPEPSQPQDQFSMSAGTQQFVQDSNQLHNYANGPLVNLNHPTLVIQQPQNQSYSYATSSLATGQNTQYQQQSGSCYYQQNLNNNSTNLDFQSRQVNSFSAPLLEFSSQNNNSSYYSCSGNTFGQLSDSFCQQPTSGYYFPQQQQQQQQQLVYQDTSNSAVQNYSPSYTSFCPRQDGGQNQQRLGANSNNNYHSSGGAVAGNAPPESANLLKGSPGTCCMAKPETSGPGSLGGLPAHHPAHHFRCLHLPEEQQRQQQHHQPQRQPRQHLYHQQQQHQQQAPGERPTEVATVRRTSARHHVVASGASRAAHQLMGSRAQVMARRKNATRETTSLLRKWLGDNTRNPYPSKSEKMMLSMVTKMSLTQVSTWFANARRRMKKENKMLAWVLQRPGRQASCGGGGDPQPSSASISNDRRSSWYFRSLVELATDRVRNSAAFNGTIPRQPRRYVQQQQRRAQVASDEMVETAENGDSESAGYESPSTTSLLGAELESGCCLVVGNFKETR